MAVDHETWDVIRSFSLLGVATALLLFVAGVGIVVAIGEPIPKFHATKAGVEYWIAIGWNVAVAGFGAAAVLTGLTWFAGHRLKVLAGEREPPSRAVGNERGSDREPKADG